MFTEQCSTKKRERQEFEEYSSGVVEHNNVNVEDMINSIKSAPNLVERLPPHHHQLLQAYQTLQPPLQ